MKAYWNPYNNGLSFPTNYASVLEFGPIFFILQDSTCNTSQTIFKNNTLASQRQPKYAKKKSSQLWHYIYKIRSFLDYASKPEQLLNTSRKDVNYLFIKHNI
jgi:hypothetical protein